MTAEARPPGVALEDVTGDPFYIGVDFYASINSDTKDVIPAVGVKLNGLEYMLPVHEAWAMGFGMINAIAQIHSFGMFPGNVSPTVGFRIADSRELMISPGTAYEIAVMMIGASMSAIHDMVVTRHFLGELGWSVKKVTGLFAGMKGINLFDYLQPPAPDGDEHQDQAVSDG